MPVRYMRIWCMTGYLKNPCRPEAGAQNLKKPHSEQDEVSLCLIVPWPSPPAGGEVCKTFYGGFEIDLTMPVRYMRIWCMTGYFEESLPAGGWRPEPQEVESILDDIGADNTYP